MAFTEVGSAVVATAGTAVRLSESKRAEPFRRLEVQTLVGNSGPIYIGNRDVSSTKGLYMKTSSDGVPAVFVMLDADPYEIWIDADTDDDGVRWAAFDS